MRASDARIGDEGFENGCVRLTHARISGVFKLQYLVRSTLPLFLIILEQAKMCLINAN